MNSFTQADIDRTRTAVAVVVAELHLPGIAVGVIADGGLVFAESVGFADIETRRPMSPNCAHRIGSVTKTMVALCAMALVEEGRLALDSRVAELLPDVVFHGPAESMAIRHLLTHTSGIGEAPTAQALADAVDPYRQAAARARDFAATYADGIEVEAVPGTRWAYANHGFALLGEILVRVERASLHEILNRRIFEPLGMQESICGEDAHARMTTGYHRRLPEDTAELFRRLDRTPPQEETVDGHNIRGDYSWEADSPMLAAGAVQSTLLDMARYAAALLGGRPRIVRPQTFAAMVAPQWCPDERLDSVGLAFERSAHFGVPSFGHGGATFGGWNTKLTVFPERGLAVLIHMNVFLYDANRVFARIMRAVLDAPIPSIPERPVDPEVHASATGVYEAPPGRLTNVRVSTSIGRVQIAADGPGLMLYSRRGAWKGGARLCPADPADPGFMLIDKPGDEPEYLLFTRDDTGRVTGLLCDRLVRMVRADAVAPWV